MSECFNYVTLGLLVCGGLLTLIFICGTLVLAKFWNDVKDFFKGDE
jgi:hypothetical protein